MMTLPGPKTIPVIIRQIEARRKVMKITYWRLAKDTGMCASHLSDIMHGKVSPTLVVLERIAARVGLGVGGIIVKSLPHEQQVTK